MFEGLKGLGALGDIGKLMGEMRAAQSKLAEAQAAIEAMEIEGVAGGGMVRAVVSGKGALQRITIEPSLCAGPGEARVIEDLVVAAVADAQAKAQERAQEVIRAIAPNLPLPPGLFGGGR